ncbi:MAG: four helix bundle protein [Cyclobacteriaceae bacterium]|nr:four helix bundle protein [Cyclobacteriaceae bacterium]MBL8030681.1 four helix bundle protein [Candidatus Doudnabacteria bacterium]
MAFAKSFNDLEVYKHAQALAQNLFELSLRFPKEERYSLTDQVRRSSRSVGAQIAEAWGKTRYPKHFVSKLTDADGEIFETQHWTETTVNCRYISTETAEDLTGRYQTLSRMINTMINKSDGFCS